MKDCSSLNFKSAIKTTVQLLRELKQKFAEEADGRFHFIGHQANLRMLEMVRRSGDIPNDHHNYNVTEFGNIAGAGSPSVLDPYWDEFDADDYVAIIGVGGGLTWTDTMVRFENLN